MNVEVYEYLYKLNQGFGDVMQSLEALGKIEFFQTTRVNQLFEMIKEARSATNSALAAIIEEQETDEAGRLFSARIVRERSED